MRRLSLAGILAVALAGVAVGAFALGRDHRGSTTTTVDAGGGLAPTGDQTIYGHVASLTQVGGRYLLRFDPASFLSGIAANAAAAEDQGTSCRPAACPPVPNDNYVVDESHRIYTYRVPPDAHVTVITNRGNPARLGATPISVAQLAQIVANGKAPGVALFEPLDSGVWIRVHIDAVRSLAQQYRP